jgi:CubicO group peptidase (beta-lactamase class C family)
MRDAKYFFLIALVCLAFLPATSPAEERNRTEILSRIDSIVVEAMERDQVVGISVGVRKGGEILVAKGYGFADLENEVKATEHTVYRIGSITKQFTAAAIMLLVERGEVRLDDELTRFLPDYPTEGRRITVDRLLTHTSGIMGYTEMGEKFWGKSRLDLSHEEMVELFSAEPFEFAPGERYQYNNSAYYLLGLIIENVSGMSYAEFLSDQIFSPLGLLETHYLYNLPIIKNRAEGYEVREDKLVNDDPLSMRLPYSAGSLGSTVMDLLRWQIAIHGNKVVNQAGYDKMTTPATLNSGEKTTYGYGLAIGNLENRRKISHGGGINGFSTQLSHYPDDDLTVVVLTNTTSAHPGALESRIARAVLGLPERRVTPVEISEEELQIYTGTYDPGRSPIEVSIEDGILMAAGSRLRPIGNHVFLAAIDDYREITFTIENGKAVALRIEREGHITDAPRVQ